MPTTLGFHVVKSAYGQWLPGDDRGHWSTAWDARIGFIEPHTLHAGDPVRQRMAAERMQHPPVRWSDPMIAAMARTLAVCAADSPWDIAAAAIEATHVHLLITYCPLDIDRTCKWLAQQITAAIHRDTDHAGPVFARGKWRSYIFDPATWQNTARYIANHNLRQGRPAHPYDFIRPHL